MLERLIPKEERSQEKESSPESSHEDVKILRVQGEIIKRYTEGKPEEKAFDWIKLYGENYRKLWDKNREQFLKLEKENPEELYGLIAQILESEEARPWAARA